MALAKLAQKPKLAGEPELHNLVPLVPLSGLEDDSLGSLGAAFSELHVRTPEGKAKEKDTGEGGAEDGHVQTDDVSSGERPSKSAPGATEHPAASSPMASTHPATHAATSSPTTTPPMAEGTCFTGMPYPTYGVEPLATEPPMAHLVIQPVACGASYVDIHQPAPCHEPRAFHGAPVGLCPRTMAASTMLGHGFTSLRGVQGPESCGGRSRGSGRPSNMFLTSSEIKEALRGAGADAVCDLTQKIRAKLGPLIQPHGSHVTIGASPHRA